MTAKQHYARQFGLPADQIKFFDELTRPQIREVQRYFSVGLDGVTDYVYAVTRANRLVRRREKRNLIIEQSAGVQALAGQVT